MRRIMIAALVVLLGLAVGSAPAAEEAKADVSAMIEKGREAIGKEEYQRAIDILQAVISELQKRMSKSLEVLFPKAPEGWTAAEIQAGAFTAVTSGAAHSQTTLSRAYTRTKDEQKITVTLSNMPQQVRGMKRMMEMYKNPRMRAMMNVDPNRSVTVEDASGWTVLVQSEKGDKPGANLTAICDAMMLAINAPGGDAALARSFLKNFDLKGMAAAGAAMKPQE